MVSLFVINAVKDRVWFAWYHPAQWAPRAARKCGWLAFLVGILVLLAWLARPAWHFPVARLFDMKVNTAIILTMASGSLLCRLSPSPPRLRFARVLSAGVIALSLATLGEYIFDRNFGIDELLVVDPAPILPGRPAPVSALAYLFVGVSLWNYSARNGLASRLADIGLMGAAVCVQIALAAYLFEADPLFAINDHTRISPQSLFGLGALVVGLFLGRTGLGMLHILGERGPGSVAIRLLLPLVVVIPLFLGWLRLYAHHHEWLSLHVGTAIYAVMQTAILVGVVFWFGSHLNTMQSQYRAEYKKRLELEELLPVCAWTKQIRWNGKWVPLEQFLKERFGLSTTHGISEEALAREFEKLKAQKTPMTSSDHDIAI